MLQSKAEVRAMRDTMSSPPVPRTAAEYRTAIAEMLAEMERLNEQMKSDQAVIDRLQAEAAVIKTETRALLATMDAAV
jgi:hypothetical protein